MAVACDCDHEGCTYDATRLVRKAGTHDRTYCTDHAPVDSEELYEDGYVPPGAHLPASK